MDIIINSSWMTGYVAFPSAVKTKTKIALKRDEMHNFKSQSHFDQPQNPRMVQQFMITYSCKIASVHSLEKKQTNSKNI